MKILAILAFIALGFFFIGSSGYNYNYRSYAPAYNYHPFVHYGTVSYPSYGSYYYMPVHFGGYYYRGW